jgi:hypothetical protein
MSGSDVLATDGDPLAAVLAHALSPSSSALKRLVTSRPVLLFVSAQMYSVGVPASDQLHLRSHPSSGNVAEMVATAASTTISNVVGMTDTEADLSVQIAARKA